MTNGSTTSDQLSCSVKVDVACIALGVVGALAIVPDLARLVWWLVVEDGR